MNKVKKLDEQPVNTRIKIAGLWTSMLFVFAYVDIFGFFRKDVLENALAGKVYAFEADQMFFILTTLYILIPCIVLYLTLSIRAKHARLINLIVSPLYILTIMGAMVDETWMYFIIGSIVEIILLIAIFFLARKWPQVSK
jgi:hypothetical protein